MPTDRFNSTLRREIQEKCERCPIALAGGVVACGDRRPLRESAAKPGAHQASVPRCASGLRLFARALAYASGYDDSGAPARATGHVCAMRCCGRKPKRGNAMKRNAIAVTISKLCHFVPFCAILLHEVRHVIGDPGRTRRLRNRQRLWCPGPSLARRASDHGTTGMQPTLRSGLSSGSTRRDPFGYPSYDASDSYPYFPASLGIRSLKRVKSIDNRALRDSNKAWFSWSSPHLRYL